MQPPTTDRWNQLKSRLAAWYVQVSAYRFRWIFIACLVTLGVSVGAVGTVLFARWQEDRATTTDTRAVLEQTVRELSQLLHSRRTTLRLIRTTLEKIPTLGALQRAALVRSAQATASDFLGGGSVSKAGEISWWVPPAPIGSLTLTRLTQHVTQRGWLKAAARHPATLIVFLDVDRPVLVMSEPLRAKVSAGERLIAVFDVRSLLAAFFKQTLQRPYPLQVTDGRQALYHTSRWPLVNGGHRLVIERPVKEETVRWTMQMRTGPVPMVPRSWLNILVVTVLLFAGSEMLGMIWTMEHLGRLATTDPLTGLPNRRFFLERWTGECERAKRYHRHVSCLMIDVNGFKPVNDVLGHHMGDRALQAVAAALIAHLRRSDLIARFGGDEFIVALPETRLKDAFTVVDKLRSLAIDGPWSRDPRVGSISLSVGASELKLDETPEAAIQRADADLYASRHTLQQLLSA